MRILELLGSPRLRGNTAHVLNLFEQALDAKHNVERVNLGTLDLHGCLGCSACQKLWDTPSCVQSDDVPALLDKMLAADVLIYATPLYGWDYTAQLKMVMDRHFCLCKWQAPEAPRSLLAGKRAALLVTCADPIENNADLLPILFQRQMDCCRCQVIGSYVVPNCTRPSALPAEAQAIAMALANAIKQP